VTPPDPHTSPAWFDDDSLWAFLGPIIFGEGFSKPAAEQVDGVLALAGVPAGASILDLPCGVGRHSLEFARRGYRVVAADRTQSYLDKARQCAAAEGLSDRIEFVRADMREFARPGDAPRFDLAVNLFTSFGYFDDPADDRRVAAGFLAALRPGGKLILELVGKEIVARIFRPRDWRDGPDNTIVLESREVARDFSWIENRWTILTPRSDAKPGADGRPVAFDRREIRFGHRLYSAAELSCLLGAVGFVNIKVYGTLTGAPYDQNAQRLVVVGEKS
jgi:SAM-dependent methyltransferase